MLSNSLHSLIKDFIPYNNSVISNDFLSKSLKNTLTMRKHFFKSWNKKLNILVKPGDFSYSYTILEENKDFLKCLLTINISYIFYKNIYTSKISKNLLLIEKSNNYYKILSLFNSEENSELFNYYYYTPINNIDYTFMTTSLINMWKSTFSKIDSLYNNFALITSKKNYRDANSKFNIDKASLYAQKYAITPNNEYTSFESYGGDCTNFVSQILHSGNIDTSKKWKPYTNSWVRVEEFYSYIVNNNIGIDVTKQNDFAQGRFLQFSTYERRIFFHSGFITYEFKNDYLYCCHTYNKLNYPLSQIYPFIYPLIRIIKIL